MWPGRPDTQPAFPICGSQAPREKPALTLCLLWNVSAVKSLGSEARGTWPQTLALPCTCCRILSRLLNHHEPQFPPPGNTGGTGNRLRGSGTTKEANRAGRVECVAQGTERVPGKGWHLLYHRLPGSTGSVQPTKHLLRTPNSEAVAGLVPQWNNITRR